MWKRGKSLVFLSLCLARVHFVSQESAGFAEFRGCFPLMSSLPEAHGSAQLCGRCEKTVLCPVLPTVMSYLCESPARIMENRAGANCTTVNQLGLTSTFATPSTTTTETILPSCFFSVTVLTTGLDDTARKARILTVVPGNPHAENG